jgi:hypothetical protein
MKTFMEAVMEIVIPVERENAGADETRPTPIVPRITLTRIIIIAVGAGREVLHSIPKGVDALGVSDVVAGL